MKDILQDIVAHTHSLGFLSLVKVSNDEGTQIDAMAEDRSVIMSATTHTDVNEFKGTFGMPNLDKLALHLKKLQQNAMAKQCQPTFTLKTQLATLKTIIAL